MATEKIQGEKRTEFGKGAARRIRRDNKIPAVIYGHGNEPLHVTLPGHEAMMALRHGGSNALLDIDIDGESHLALTKDVQVDHIHRLIDHIDFITVKRGEKVHVEVPVHVVGDAAPETLVVTDNTVVLVEAEATHIPEYFEVSVDGAQVGTLLYASDLQLPEGTTLLADPETLLVNVTQQMSEEALEAELAAAEEEAGIEHDLSDEEEAELAESGESAGTEAAEGESSEAAEGESSEDDSE